LQWDDALRHKIKAIFARFGIRTLRPTMRKVAEGLEDLRAPYRSSPAPAVA
jgi:hypothetical protein